MKNTSGSALILFNLWPGLVLSARVVNDDLGDAARAVFREGHLRVDGGEEEVRFGFCKELVPVLPAFRGASAAEEPVAPAADREHDVRLHLVGAHERVQGAGAQPDGLALL